MRLDSIREILEKNISRLSLNSEAVDRNMKISSFRNAIEGVRNIRETGMFQRLCNSLLSQEVISLAAEEPIVVPTATFNTFNVQLSELKTRAQFVFDALTEVIEPLPVACIRVKLPDTSDLDDAGKVIIQLNKLLDQLVVNTYLDGKVSLQGFAQGSIWVDVCLGSILAYRFIAGLVTLYYEIKQRQLQAATREIALKDLELTSEVRKALFTAIRNEVESYSKKRLLELLQESAVRPDDHEFERRVENSLKVLGSLLERGLEIHPSLTAPAKDKKLLPDPKRIGEAIKSLPSGDEDQPQEKNEA